jgi:putative ABC transport system substrate-binding protein
MLAALFARVWAAALMVVACALQAHAQAQPAEKLHRIGVLSSRFDPAAGPSKAFVKRLSELGYVEGKNIAIDWRYSPREDDHLQELAADLVRQKVDVILTDVTLPTRAAMKATSTTPVVMAIAADPVIDGLVDSLAHPGGNVTGVALMLAEVSGKRLDLLKEAVPSATRIDLLWHPPTPWHTPMLPLVNAAATSLGIRLQAIPLESPDRFEAAFAAMAGRGVQGVLFGDNPFFTAQQARLLELAARHHLPTMHASREWPVAGALMSYGPSNVEMFRRAGEIVAKVLAGAKPSDLPVEQPTNFELVINLRTAKALGLTIPNSLLLRATELIE